MTIETLKKLLNEINKIDNDKIDIDKQTLKDLCIELLIAKIKLEYLDNVIDEIDEKIQGGVSK